MKFRRVLPELHLFTKAGMPSNRKQGSKAPNSILRAKRLTEASFSCRTPLTADRIAAKARKARMERCEIGFL